MDKANELLDEVKRLKDLSSDYALAKHIGISRALLHYYSKGERSPDQYACMKIAQELNLPLGAVISQVEIDAEKNEQKRHEWEKYYACICKAVISFMIAAFMPQGVDTFKVTEAVENLRNQGSTCGELTELQIMRLFRKVAAIAHNRICNFFQRAGYAY